MRQYLLEIYYLLGAERKKLPILIGLFICASLLELIGLGLVGPYVSLLTNSDPLEGGFANILISIGLENNPQSLIPILGFILIAFFFIKTIANIWVNYKIFTFSQNQDVRLRSHLMKSYQSLTFTDYMQRNSSEYVDICLRIVGQYTKAVLINLLRAIADIIVTFSIVIFFMWHFGEVLLILLVLFSILIYSYNFFVKGALKRYGKITNISSKKVIQALNESMSGFKEIRILNKESYFYNKLNYNSKRFAKNQKYSLILSSLPRFIMEFIMIVFIVSIVLFYFKNTVGIISSLPMIGMLGVATIRVFPAASNISTTLTQLNYSRDAVSILYKDILNFNQDIAIKTSKEDKNKANFENFKSLEIKGISFYYPNSSKIILNDINIKINKGDSVGIIGPSGSGKSSLVDVLLGLLEPSKGEILYNKKPIEKNLSNWRSQIAYIPQEIFLIDDTLRHNVALGIEDANIDNNLVYQSLKQASLLEMVEQMENGIETILGENGVRLSGGQRQRIALARSFYNGRDILIMDEATSALDTKTEEEIVREIQQFKGKRTIIVIAHRLTTVMNCDYILRLEDGCIVNSGPPKQVL
jgi:ABC-type multidrug transport system fused ATPase/permease subunit